MGRTFTQIVEDEAAASFPPEPTCPECDGRLSPQATPLAGGGLRLAPCGHTITAEQRSELNNAALQRVRAERMWDAAHRVPYPDQQGSADG